MVGIWAIYKRRLSLAFILLPQHAEIYKLHRKLGLRILNTKVP